MIASVIAVMAVGWVAFSRIYEAQHHPTDVFAGLCMGVGALGTTVLAIRPERAGGPMRRKPNWGQTAVRS